MQAGSPEALTFLGGQPLRRQLGLLVLATAGPLLLAAVLSFAALVASERENTRNSLMTSAATLAALVDNEIDTHAAVASTLAQSPTLLAEDLPAFWLEAKKALEFVPGAWLAVSDPDGQIILDTLTPPGTPLPRHAAFELIQRGFETHRPQVGDLVLGLVAQRLTGFVEVPVFRDGKPAYSLSISLVPARFLALINRQFTHGEVVAIVDLKHNVVARIPDNDNRLGKPASVGWRAAMDARPGEGWAENQTLEGNPSLTAYVQGKNGWTVGVALLESDINTPLRKILVPSALAGAALTMLSFALAALLARGLARGMAAISATAARLGKGETPTAANLPFREAEVIHAALVDASAELDNRRELLVRANAELEIRVAERTRALVAEAARREASEDALRQSQKMESIGQLTGGIAHDFNNMLTIIMGNLDTILRRLPTMETAAIQRHVEAGLHGAALAAQLTHRLLAFARRQPLQPAPVDLNAVVVGMRNLLQRSVGEGVEIATILAPDLRPAFADANQVENSLVNLAVNARDAMDGSGKITIETANVHAEDIAAPSPGDADAGHFVMLSVSDDGKGIAAENLHKIFEPFFTTKEAGKGTGLGLAMIHGFVTQSHGRVKVESQLGRGTSVKLFLPRLNEAWTAPAVTPAADAFVEAAPRAKPGETILLVEDEANVREFAVFELEDLGYRVLAAGTGEEALKALAGAGRIDLLFTDLVLPGAMSGKSLADEIGRRRPSLPVLFTTGYARDAIIAGDRVDAGLALLNKPYTQRELAREIRRVLDQGSREVAGESA